MVSNDVGIKVRLHRMRRVALCQRDASRVNAPLVYCNIRSNHRSDRV